MISYIIRQTLRVKKKKKKKREKNNLYLANQVFDSRVVLIVGSFDNGILLVVGWHHTERVKPPLMH